MGACSTATSELGQCVACKKSDETDGDGTTQGTCEPFKFCNEDGSCSTCSNSEGGHAGTMADPHTGCSNNFPKCLSGMCFCIGTTGDPNAIGDGTVQGSCASALSLCVGDVLLMFSGCL